MKYKKTFIIISVVLSIILYSVSRAGEKWRSITVSGGLPHKNVKDIKTDKKTVYIATANGLAIYDITKKSIMVLKAKDGLGDNYISSLAVDRDFIWIGTGNGLSRYAKKTKKIVTFRKKDGLADNAITSVAVDGDYVWVGTKYWGISRLDKVVNKWRSFTVLDQLVDNAVNCITVEEDFVWVGSPTGLSCFDKVLGMWNAIDSTMGIPANTENIKSIEVAGEYLWLGTVNGLVRFDKSSIIFKLYTTTEGLVDDFIQTLKLDGLYLWIGTFMGVTRYNIQTGEWKTYTVQDGLIENSVTSMDVDGNFIWFGTDNGISIFDKEIPQAFINTSGSYSKAGTLVLTGTAYDHDNIASYSIKYKNDSMKDYVSAGILIPGKNNVIQGKLGTWDVSQLINVRYDVRLTVIDKKGNKNIAKNAITVDTKSPEVNLSLLPDAVDSPSVFIRGTYIDDNISKISININNETTEKAELNKISAKFSKEIELKKGMNNITVTAFDVANLSREISAKIVYDREKPLIKLNEIPASSKESEITLGGKIIDSGIERVLLNPGNIEVPLTDNKDGSFSFSLRVSLSPGKNKFEITAYDFVDNKAVKNLEIEYASSLPVLTLNKDILRVTKADFEIKGEYSDDNVDYILIEPFKKKASIDTKNRKFSLKARLIEGENVITANIVDKDGNKNVDVISVIYSTEKTGLDLLNIPKYTFESSIKLNGIYSEPNLDKIILNPGEISVSVNRAAKSFSIRVNLEEGENKFEVVMTDKVGTKTSKDFSILMDSVEPSIELGIVPKTVYSKRLDINGKVVEENIESLTVQPYGITCNINKADNTFSVIINLKEGKNEFKFIALDRAGNKTTEHRAVTYIPKALEVVEGQVDPEYVNQLRAKYEARIAELEKLLASGSGFSVVYRVVYKEKEYVLPNKKGLALVSYSKLNGNSLFEISRKYMGNYIYIDFINKYNNVGMIKKYKTILLPTKKFIKDYIKIDNKKIKDIVDIIAICFKSSGRNPGIFKQKLAFNLFKKDIISKNDYDFFNKYSYLKDDDFMISLGKARKGNHPYVINIVYSRSFMDINIKRNILYGRK